jgi:hypothetical protein
MKLGNFNGAFQPINPIDKVQLGAAEMKSKTPSQWPSSWTLVGMTIGVILFLGLSYVVGY